MAREGTRRPKITWGRLLDSAPYFIETLWSEDDALTPDYAPLVRAVAYFDIFRGQVENGGISQYLYNKSTTLPHFSEAPDIVRRHPELKDVADLMLLAHGDKEMVRHYEKAFKEQNQIIRRYITTGEGGDTPITYEEKYRTFSDAFDERALAINDRALMRVQAHILREPQAYLEISAAPGITGVGVEFANLEGYSGAWEARFVDGFPVGPNFQTDEYANRRIMRFSTNRMHLEFDHRVFREGEEPTREWFDFAAGVGGERSFKNGALESLSNKRGLSADHGLREYYEPDGTSRSASVELGEVRVEMYHPTREGSPFTVTMPLPSGGKVRRKYFANGQLNIMQEYPGPWPFRTTHCYDESGADLAPNGSGEYRELWSMEDAGPRWRIGRIIDGLLDGEVRYINPDGSIWSIERWRMGHAEKQG